jgi:glucosamine kinase
MILIADSGATKTDWRQVFSRQDVRSFQTDGFNPFFVDSRFVRKEVESELVPFIDSRHVKEVFFYGAGCSEVEQCIVVEDGLTLVFPDARIKVENDLLGAARALCGHQEGIACILGTGSNSCFYDGKRIIDNVPSLGYILGDEGSGAYIGKKLLREVLTLSAPTDIRQKFSDKFNYTRVHILKHVYNQEMPSRFLASFMRFISENISYPFIHMLVRDAFHDFFKSQVLKYQRYVEVPVYCTGSIAFYFSDILKEVAKENGIEIKKILPSPIEGLTEYHLVEFEKFNSIKYSSDPGE